MEIVLHEIVVLVRADKLTAGKELLPKRARLERVPKIIVADLQAKTIAFLHQHFPLDQSLARTRQQKGHHLIGQVLLLEHPLRNLLDFGRRNVGRRAQIAAKNSSAMHRGVRVGSGAVVKDARHQGDDHGDRGDRDDHDEDSLN